MCEVIQIYGDSYGRRLALDMLKHAQTKLSDILLGMLR